MTVLMSFWPEIYNKISNQIKIIEYRRRFPKNCSYALMYVSKPIKAICGIIYFGKQHNLNDWKIEYLNNSDVIERIIPYIEKYNYGTEILGFQKIKPISLDELRENVPNFVAPQSYILLENNSILKKYIYDNIIYIDEKKENHLIDIFPEHICKEY